MLALHGEAYELVPASEVLPEVELVEIARYAVLADQHEALKAFRDELRR